MDTVWLTRLALLVAVSFALNALLSTFADALWERVGPDVSRTERDTIHPEGPPIQLGSTSTIIVGMGRAGVAAYDYFKEKGKRPLGLEADPAVIEHNLADGRRVLYGIAQDRAIWDKLDYDRIESIILTIPDPGRKLLTVKQLRESGYTGPISALARDEESPNKLREAGVFVVALPIAQAGYELARASLGEYHPDISNTAL